MMMKPIKCKKLAVSRVSAPPRSSESPGVPFIDDNIQNLMVGHVPQKTLRKRKK